jgi:hypothetical protein
VRNEGRHRTFLAGAALLVLALPAAVSAMPSAVPSANWAPPTPEEGQRFTATVGSGVVFALAANAPGSPAVTVSIAEEGLPLGAKFEQVAGNPATATVEWTPAADQAGLTFAVTFTAQPNTPAVAPAARNITLVAVKAKPKPRAKPKKVALCYRGRTIKVKRTAVKRYLKRGAKRGRCRPKKT